MFIAENPSELSKTGSFGAKLGSGSGFRAGLGPSRPPRRVSFPCRLPVHLKGRGEDRRCTDGDSIANAEVREQAEEAGVYIEPGTGNETGEPGVIDSLMTCLILGLFAFGIRFGELFVRDAGSPVYYAIIVFPIAPFFFYHFFSWGFR